MLHVIVPRITKFLAPYVTQNKVPTETNLFQWLDGAIRECYFEREKNEKLNVKIDTH